jgi:hypothetical protein
VLAATAWAVPGRGFSPAQWTVDSGMPGLLACLLAADGASNISRNSSRMPRLYPALAAGAPAGRRGYELVLRL